MIEMKLNRRTFLRYTGIAGAALLGTGCLREPQEVAWSRAEAYEIPRELRLVSDYTLDLYRSEFQYTLGDSRGYSFHCVNCKGNCAWVTYEKNGAIVREEQLAKYPQINPGIPDANPRGCNKGALHSQALYEKNRLLYPLRRTGKRGEGRWKRISWEEALEEIARNIVKVLVEEGPHRLMINAGTGILSPGRRGASLRIGSLLGATRLYVASAVGDMFTGATLAYGIPMVGHTSEAWFEADYILLLAINPSVSRIPDAHYLWEGKYRGAKVVTVSPEYNATARQSSLWIPINPGTDSFFVMSMVHVILKEKLYDEDFIREQTDLPFLVKVEDGRLLRQSDLMETGRDDIFYFYDEAGSKVVEAPGTRGSSMPTLRLQEARPALEGVFKIRDHRGREIEVTPVFEVLRKEAAKYSPEETQGYTGIHPSVVYNEAREFAGSRIGMIMIGYQLHKYMWGILACWGAALLLALTGHAGRRGGMEIDMEWSLEGLGILATPKPARFTSGFLGEWMNGEMWRSFRRHYMEEELRRKAGVGKEELIALAREALEKKQMPYYGKPRVMILFHDNMFVRNSAQEDTVKSLLEEVRLYVNVNYRMDSSAQLADILLPTYTNYETWDFRADPGYARYANLMMPPEGLRPVGETKSEWEICMLLAKKIQEVAEKEGVNKIEDPEFGVTRDLDTLYEDFINVDGRRITSDKELLEWMMGVVPALRGWNLKMARQTGFIPLNELAGQISPLYPDRPYYTFEKQVVLKRPYPTVSGRQQFYIDHELYLKLGCATPTAREPVRPSRYPLAYYTPHSRYGIHSTWREVKYHLRLQRGIPHVCINPGTARRKGIKDGDTVRVFNDVGEIYAMAKLHPGTPPGVVWMEHAWENLQFKEGKGYNTVVAGLLSPLELVGGYGHLSFSPLWDGNQLASEASVDIEKAGR